jgi:pseudaminic acid biosynthesis-associated methylase
MLSMRSRTEQETFWHGDFGNEYTQRNPVAPGSRLPFFREILTLATRVQSVCEIGANAGHNLMALQHLIPSLRAIGVEPNACAYAKLSSIPGIIAVRSSVQDYEPEQQVDLAFTCGVLIHINPADLPQVYRKIAAISRKYVLINEYFNPTRLRFRIEAIPASCSNVTLPANFWMRPRDSSQCVGVSSGVAWNRRGVTLTGLCSAAVCHSERLEGL